MLKVRYKYADKEFILEPYTTSQEKDLLLLSAVGDDDLELALSICGVKDSVIDDLSTMEKKAMLCKLREISVGSEVNVTFKCISCKAANENTINIENIILPPVDASSEVTDVFKEVTDENLNEFVVVSDIKDLDLDVYDDLMKTVKNSVHTFDFKKPSNCQKCGCVNKINIEGSEFIFSTLSEDSLMSLYQTYNDLTFFGKYTKADIDGMYPFERTIFISLLNKSREDLNK